MHVEIPGLKSKARIFIVISDASREQAKRTTEFFERFSPVLQTFSLRLDRDPFALFRCYDVIDVDHLPCLHGGGRDDNMSTRHSRKGVAPTLTSNPIAEDTPINTLTAHVSSLLLSVVLFGVNSPHASGTKHNTATSSENARVSKLGRAVRGQTPPAALGTNLRNLSPPRRYAENGRSLLS